MTAPTTIDVDDEDIGLAIISADNVNGMWEYQYSSNTSWVTFPNSISRESALLLPYNSQVRFSPNPDFFGITYFMAHAWDMSRAALDNNITAANRYTGPFSYENVTIELEVVPVNDPSVIILATNESTVSYRENGPEIAIFTNGLQISDIDNAYLAFAVVVLDCPGCDRSDLFSGLSSSANFGSGISLTSTPHGDLILTTHRPPNFVTTLNQNDFSTELIIMPRNGTTGSIYDFVKYLQSLRFFTTNKEPDRNNRTVRLYVHDGTDVSNTVEVIVSIELVNDNVPEIELPYNMIAFIENSQPIPLFNTAPTIRDADDNSIFLLYEATLSLLNADLTYEGLFVQDECTRLNLNCTFVSGELTISGRASIFDYERVLGAVYYVNNISEPEDQARIILISVSDGVFVSPLVQLQVDIELINDQLPVVVLSQQTIDFQEGNPISSPVRVAPGVTVTDADSAVFPVDSVTVHLIFVGNPGEEGLNYSSLPHMDGLDLEVETPNSSFIRLSNSIGLPLMVVRDFLRNVEYFNTAPQPHLTDRIVRITVFDDFNLTGVQANIPTDVTVEFTFIDDPPFILLNRELVRYSEGQVPISITVAPNASIVDVDNVNISGLRIILNASSDDIAISQEVLAVDVFDSDVVVNNSTDTVIYLQGIAPLATYTSILQSLTYQNLVINGDPNSGDRILRAYPIDLEGNLGEADELIISFNATNNAPTLDLNGPQQPMRDFYVTFVEEGVPVSLLSPDFILDDVDSSELASVDVEFEPVEVDPLVEFIEILTNMRADMSMPGEASEVDAGMNINISVTGNRIILEGQPRAPIEEFRALLSGLVYSNEADEPSVIQRNISITVSDGQLFTTAYALVNFQLVNDRPMLQLDQNQQEVSVVFIEESGPIPIFSNPTILDPDSSIAELRVRVIQSQANDTILGEGLYYNASLLVYQVVFDPPVSPSEAEDAVMSIQFDNSALEPPSGGRRYCLSVVDDSFSVSDEACVNISLRTVNDNIPVFTQMTYLASVMENIANELVIQVSAIDPDVTNSAEQLYYDIVSGDDCTPTTSGIGSGMAIDVMIDATVPCRFFIDNATGMIFTTSNPPDREQISEYVLEVSVTDGDVNRVVMADVRVSIVDVNDNIPRFNPTVYTVTVPLGAQSGDTLIQLVIVDPDDGAQVSILLEVMDPTASNAFDNDDLGRVFLAVNEDQLDPTISQYILEYSAIDNESFQPAPVNAILEINVILNDNTPEFIEPMYNTSVLETVEVGTSVLSVQATDSDQGSHGELSYSLEPTGLPFTINMTTGDIYVTDMLNFEAVEEYQFQAVASDHGRPVRSSSVDVTVTVENVNEESPTFLQSYYHAQICESAQVGTEFLRVTAIDGDGDEFGTVTYSFSETNPPACNGCLFIDQTIGSILVYEELDFEQYQYLNFTVVATDGGSRYTQVPVMIRLFNDNEFGPTFNFPNLEIVISENYPVGGPLPILSEILPVATDMDACNVDQCNSVGEIIDNTTCSLEEYLQYFIISGNDDGNFRISSSTGIITLGQVLEIDTNEPQVFTLTISATDGEFTSESPAITITVRDSDEHLPIFDNATYSVGVPEDRLPGTFLVRVSAADQDLTADIIYSLAGVGAVDFTINATTGNIYVAANLDFETMARYELIVIAIDQSPFSNGSTTAANLIIVVTNINDHQPVFTQDIFYFSFRENMPVGSFIGIVSAVDFDAGSTSLSEIGYSIRANTPGQQGTFTINLVNGTIRSNATFDREQFDHYNLTVLAQDGGVPPLSSTARVVVTILDDNDNRPEFSETEYLVTIQEDTAVNVSIVELSASDNDVDLNGQITYFIVSGNEDGHFSIDTDGMLYVISSLDREQRSEFMLQVSASDNGVPSLASNTTVSIEITDANDSPPQFVSPIVFASILENSPEGYFVVLLIASDADLGMNSIIEYEIMRESDGFGFAFSIDGNSGEVFVSDQTILDREVNPVLNFTVTAFNPNDADGENGTVLVSITLLDENDEAPEFLEETFVVSITEDFTPVDNNDFFAPGSGSIGRNVTRISAIDRDDPRLLNSQFQFFITGGSGIGIFAIDPQTGDIITETILDREAENFYYLTVRATDLGNSSLSSFALVNISILDINDNPPIFSDGSYTASVPENRIGGFEALQVIASDADINENAELRFSLLNPDTVPFQINRISGRIQTTAPLDRESVATWELEINVTDLGVPAMNALVIVNVAVVDVNDNPPTIVPQSLFLTIRENTVINTVVFPFQILDRDTELNAESNVTLVGQSSSFDITNTGNLTVVGTLDYEMLQQQQFMVSVRNIEPPHHMASANVLVLLENVNDNPPMILFNQATVPYFEGLRELNLDIGISIVDNDGRNITILRDAIIEFVNPSNLEPSFAFTPNTDDLYLPYNCPLEAKAQKIEACGIPDIVLPIQADLDEVNLRVSDRSGYTILLNSSLEQYVIDSFMNVDLVQDSGLTIATWIWIDPLEIPARTAILAKSSLSSLLYGVFCDVNSSLEFQYYDGNSLSSVTFPNVCNMLESAWHHLSLIVDSSEAQWMVRVFVDGRHIGSQTISPIADDIGRAYVGSRAIIGINSPTTDYFNGRLHLMIVSNSIADQNIINCAIGCGIVIRSRLVVGSTPLNHNYDYSRRALIVEGLNSIGTYETFLNSLSVIFPFTEPRSSQYFIAFTVQDDEFNSLPAEIVIPVVPSNDFIPELSLNGALDRDFSAVFIEERGPIAVLNQSSYFLTDMDLIAFPYVITVQILNPQQPDTEERLDVRSIPEGLNIFYENYVFTISGNLPLPMYETVLRTLTYDNTRDEPIGSSRQLLFTVRDSPRPDVTAETIIEIILENDLPELTLTFVMREYGEGAGEVAILSFVNITDSDNNTLSSATVTFNALDGMVEVLNTNTTGTSIVANYDRSTNVLSLEGQDSLQNYANVLQQITYIHLVSQGNPTAGTRIFEFTLFDGLDQSLPVPAMLFFAAINDAPVLDLNGPNTSGLINQVMFTEDITSSILLLSPEATLDDVDNDTLSWAQVSLSPTPDGAMEYLTAAPPSGSPLLNVDSGNSFILSAGMNSSANIADFLAALATVRYVNEAEEPTHGSRTVEFIVSDGLNQSIPVFTTVNVETRNDPPYLDLDVQNIGTNYQAIYTEEEPAVSITSRNVSISDNDAGSIIQMVMISIQNPSDGLSEVIESSDPEIILPTPSLVGGVTLSYIIYPNNTSPAFIEYLLTTLTYLNNELEPRGGVRIISISLSDGIDFSNTGVVNLIVDTINDNPPRFQQNVYPGTILENQPRNSTVNFDVPVEAIDADSGIDGIVSYEIVNSNPPEGQSLFLIRSSGVIYTTQSLDRESTLGDHYTLNVSAFDAGDPQLRTFTTVTILIQDENDEVPIFSPDTQFNLTVLELSPVGFLIDTLQAVDNDLFPNAQVFFEQVDGFNSPFSVLPDGLIIVAQPLNANVLNPVYSMVIRVTNVASPALSSEGTFTITIIDENNNAPQFIPSSMYETNISESLLPRFPVLRVSAIDQDTSSNAEIIYSFENPDTAAIFTIDAVSGEIFGEVSFDREAIDTYDFAVVAVDHGNPPLSSVAQIKVNVEDANDNRPEFSMAIYTAEITENASPGTSLLNITAQDRDAGSNAAILYSIVTMSEVMPLNSLELVIDSITGMITVEASPDYELQQVVNFTVQATDQGEPQLTGTAVIQVTILDVNDNPPVFGQSRYRASVPENKSEEQCFVATVMADDLDSNHNGDVRYYFVGDTGPFVIDEQSGNITTLSSLDFETNCSYMLTVLALDNGFPSLNSTVIVDILVDPVPDIAPSFDQSSYMVLIHENLPVSTRLFQVSASDDDLEECLEAEQEQGMASGSGSLDIMLTTRSLPIIVYSLENFQDVFTINSSTGEIVTLVGLDRENVELFELLVRVTDEGGLFDQVILSVSVIDVNDNIPMFLQSQYQAVINENALIETLVLQVMATDDDTLDEGALVYTLVGQPAFFEINNQTGEVLVSGTINFETEGESVSFSAVVSDTAGQSSSAVVTVTISDVNDVPPIIQTIPSIRIFIEGQVSVEIFSNITIIDPDSSQQLCSAKVDLTSPQNSTNALGRECQCVNSTDASRCTSGCMEFIQLPMEAFIGNVTQTNGGLSLTLEGLFSITIYEQAIESIQYINTIFNPIPEDRTVSVRVFDCQLDSNTLEQRIEINLLNIFPPVLDLNGLVQPGLDFQTSFIERGDPVAIVSMDVSITDQDTVRDMQELTRVDIWIANPVDAPDEIIDLSITGPNGIILTRYSSHNISLTGTASLSAYQDALLRLTYSNRRTEPNPVDRLIRFVAHEYFLSSTTVTTVVSINSINDHPAVILTAPPLENSRTTFIEGSNGIEVVARDAFIDDEDASEDSIILLEVSLFGPATYDYIFLREGVMVSDQIAENRISNTSLMFSGTTSRIDYEVILRNILYRYTGEEFESLFPSKFLLLQITDTAYSSFSAVQISLEPVNDQMPQFFLSVYNIRLNESASIGTSVIQLEVSDGDRFSTSNPQFSISSGNENDFFFISQDNGTIYLNRPLDFETSPLHQLLIHVVDTLYAGAPTPPSASVVNVMIGDVNDHIPMFDNDTYEVTIGEGTPIGTSILQVTATDRDSEVNSQLVFAIFGQREFTIDPQFGIIYVAGDIDRETAPSYSLAVTVRNPGSSTFDTAIVSVIVLDLDDNQPSLTLSPASVILREPATRIPLATMLNISDLDPNPSLDFAIVEVLSSDSSEPTIGSLISQVNSNYISTSGNGTQKLEFRSISTPLEAYEEVLRGVIYEDISDEPERITRLIAYQVGSAAGMSSILELNYAPGDTVSNVSQFVVMIELINDNPPQLLLDTRDAISVNFTLPLCSDGGSFSTVYMENSTPVLLSDPSLSLVDPDSGENIIRYAYIELLGGLDSGYESITANVMQPDGSISLRNDSTDSLLILEGPADLPTFADAIKSIR